MTATPHVPKRFIPFGAALLLAGCGRPGGPQAPSPDARGELLAPGDTRAGALTLASPQFSDGSRYALFAFTARPGDTLTARLTSDDFDPFLIVADAHGNSLRKDDDDGGACNAQITFTPPSPAQPAAAEPSGAPVYRLYVNSAAKAELGTFQLSLVRGPGVAPADTSCRGFGGVKGLIQIGQTITDSLTAGDPLFTSDSTYFQRWILPVRAGRPFTVDLSSRAFDAYLILSHGRGDRIASDDDGGPGCDARLVYTPPDDRPLRVIVNTSSRPKHQLGAFTLRVAEGLAVVDSSHDCQGYADPTRVLHVGRRVESRLTATDMMFESDSTYAQIWTLEGTAGDTVTVDLVSEDFDAYLLVSGPGLATDLQDDDSGGLCNARVTVVFPRSGSYQVVANTSDKLTTGRFSLAVTAGRVPASRGPEGECRQP